MNETNQFELPLKNFDLSLLPPHARDTASEAFREALNQFIQHELAGFARQIDVLVDPKSIRVRWSGSAVPEEPLRTAVAALSSGEFARGIQILQLLLKVRPDDALVLYNLGMALSEVGNLEEAIEQLRRAAQLNPFEANPKVALGVALMRNRNAEEAEPVLREAVKLEPDNPFALRNLGGCLLELGSDLPAAEECLVRATKLAPTDQQAWLGLGQTLVAQGKTSDADEAFKQVIAINDRNPIAEQAKQSRSRIAQEEMRSRAGGGIRMDAVMYCRDALAKYEELPPSQVKQIALEITLLGTKGLNPNDSARLYTLKSLNGSFTALRLLSHMFVAFKQFAPDHDIGFDLQREYEMALKMKSPGQGA